MSEPFRCAVLSVVKHGYVPRGVAAHPRFELAVVADDPDRSDWTHERNQAFADEYGIPYVRDVERAMREFDVQVAVVSSEAERHCDLSVRAAEAGLHVVQDKPMSTRLDECDRVVDAVERSGVQFLLWNRNGLPAVVHAAELVRSGDLGDLFAVHSDFYFAKDCGPPKGSRRRGYPPIDWQQHQIAAHRDGSDGGIGTRAMGELEIEGIYPLAYLQLLTQSRVEKVFARTTAHFHQVHADNGVDDLATVSLHMANGVTGTLCIGRIGAASHPDIGEIKLHLLGTRGAAVVSEARPEVAVHYRDQPRNEFPHRRVGIDNDFLLMDSLARAIDGTGSSALDVRTARAITATVHAAIESGRTGEVVTVAHRDN